MMTKDKTFKRLKILSLIECTILVKSFSFFRISVAKRRLPQQTDQSHNFDGKERARSTTNNFKRNDKDDFLQKMFDLNECFREALEDVLQRNACVDLSGVIFPQYAAHLATIKREQASQGKEDIYMEESGRNQPKNNISALTAASASNQSPLGNTALPKLIFGTAPGVSLASLPLFKAPPAVASTAPPSEDFKRPSIFSSAPSNAPSFSPGKPNPSPANLPEDNKKSEPVTSAPLQAPQGASGTVLSKTPEQPSFSGSLFALPKAAPSFLFDGNAQSASPFFGSRPANSLHGEKAMSEQKEDDAEEEESEVQEGSPRRKPDDNPLIRTGLGEEDEDVLCEIRSKLFVKQTSNEHTDNGATISGGGGGWMELGVGLAKVNASRSDNTQRRFIFRVEGSGKTLLNAWITPSAFTITLAANGKDVLIVCPDMRSTVCQYLLRTKQHDHALHLQQQCSSQ